MTPARWARVQRAFDAALDLETGEHAAFLARTAGEDPEVAREVGELLGWDARAAGFLETRRLRPPRPIPRPGPGQRIGGRYVLEDPLGAGGSGVVWSARDELSGEPVAVKLLPPGRDYRTEAATLRLLRLPGVVSLRDEGLEDGRAFIVTDALAGRPFPGPIPASDWAGLADTVQRLFEIVARIHWAGVVHCDLKPGNVLVDDQGQPTVLDLGIATEPAESRLRVELGVAGTPAYLAPERLAGRPATPACDVYALGVMTYEALAGRRPHRADSVDALLRRVQAHDAPPLADLAPHVPARVSAWVDRLLARDPGRRPATAREALAALTGATPAPLLRGSAPRSPRELRELFLGPDRVLHLREDAARELWDRSGGDPARAEAVLRSWERSGLARREGSRYVVSRAGLDRLRGGLPLGSSLRLAASGPADKDPGSLRSLLRDGRHREAAVAAERLAEAQAREGLLGFAGEVAHLGLLAARRAGAQPPEARLLSLLLELGLERGSRVALEGVLRELLRVRGERPALIAVEAVTRGALAALEGNPGRARRLLLETGPVEPPRLERWRWAVLAVAARSLAPGEAEAIVAPAVAWAAAQEDPRLRAAGEGWAGWHHYLQARFREAGECHRRCAALCRHRAARVSAALNGAAAWLEASRLEEAAELALRAREEAARCRHVHYEARAEYLLRAIAYRRGDPGPVDEELLAAVAAVGLHGLDGRLALVEAAVAWRAGERERARQLAQRATAGLGREGSRLAWLLARALALACGAAAETGEPARLAAEALDGPLPGLGLQTLALLSGLGELGVGAAAAPALAERVSPAQRERRREVLSPAEALALWARMAQGPPT